MALNYKKSIGLFLLLSSIMSCKDKDVTLNVIDPGHFHASLLQKSSLEGVSYMVNVYAPQGEELEQYLKAIEGYNTREDNPTSWQEQIYVGDDFLSHLPKDSGHDVVMLAGNNRRKSEYILSSVEKCYNVLSDKPMAIDQDGWEKLKTSYDVAEEKELILYDLMTERYDILNNIVRDIVNNESVFGKFEYQNGPSVSMKSVHHFYKEVGGNALKRPEWYYDVTQQGEGIADVTTHLIDLVFWQCFPEQSIETNNVSIEKASHYPTWISRNQYALSTGADDFPPYLKQIEENGSIPVMANGSIDFKVFDMPVRMEVKWNWTPESGSGDTFEAVYNGTKVDVVVRQDASTDFVKSIFLTDDSLPTYNALKDILKKYPGVRAEYKKKEIEIIVPLECRVSHEDHFNMVASQFLKYVRGEEKMPLWEKSNTLTKYYITTKSVEMASL